MKVSIADWQKQGNLGVVSLATATFGAAPGQLFVGTSTINVSETGV